MRKNPEALKRYMRELDENEEQFSIDNIMKTVTKTLRWCYASKEEFNVNSMYWEEILSLHRKYWTNVYWRNEIIR